MKNTVSRPSLVRTIGTLAAALLGVAALSSCAAAEEVGEQLEVQDRNLVLISLMDLPESFSPSRPTTPCRPSLLNCSESHVKLRAVTTEERTAEEMCFELAPWAINAGATNAAFGSLTSQDSTGLGWLGRFTSDAADDYKPRPFEKPQGAFTTDFEKTCVEAFAAPDSQVEVIGEVKDEVGFWYDAVITKVAPSAESPLTTWVLDLTIDKPSSK